MPNGTYGGVRGEAGDGFTYSIMALDPRLKSLSPLARSNRVKGAGRALKLWWQCRP